MAPPDDVLFDDQGNDYYDEVAKGTWYTTASFNIYRNRISIYLNGFCHSTTEPVEGELCEITLHELLHWADPDAPEGQVHQMAYKLIWDRVFKEI